MFMTRKRFFGRYASGRGSVIGLAVKIMQRVGSNLPY